ncbi:LacI family transcriptional regulator/LacI family transcriptional regulator, repressor for deo operon, udp, cdd, tsx, nupC, and nupG [Catalinimonas alkaloidigena]|uniref:LacI family transcriptional regulator/LacI family transcriptional regulator, repressor for deo operon, udp, cdd, tsx, nupC, and nupG n=1 Tax=Catalinimonas alkaloidigena TaxID=1075417 RepID=A0A1G9BBF2_9BACT|nr:LacI family DNA-binding transcriptional regulator [Catalinimonas alkaloidigena]SDK36902.1 LacI family transcriptional regulator/LacI family transcriptional regulator, repressor for deo operon, udp, cdd, tsx, nupC, and nupG [Catalinimonas alkaloidigena]
MKKTQATIVDIAHALNISPSTVSRALKDHPRISKKTREAVKALAKELDYQPNPLALSLLNRRTHTIGVILPEITHHFFSAAISGIQETALAAGYNVMFCQSNERQEQEEAAATTLLRNKVDGLLASITRETKSDEHFEAFRRRGVPVVFFDRAPETQGVSKVVVDDYDGAFQAVEHLIERGARRIAHLMGSESLPISHERLQGYRAALKKHGLPTDEELIGYTNIEREQTRAATEKLLALPQPPDGIFAFNDYIALFTLQLLRERKIRIPEDIALVGFSNDPLGTIVEPHLTTIAQPAFEMGQTATRILLEQIEAGGDVEVEPTTTILRTHMIVRGSSVPEAEALL